jgi:lincosamide nucleotidyltransferase A/C/D/E
MYPAPSLTGFGVIGGQSVQCISAEWSVKFHTGYTLHDSDYHDVTSICDRFGIEYPEEYAKLKNSGEFRSLPKKRLHWRDLILL